MSLESGQSLQRQLAAHLRDPQRWAAPAHLEDRRVAVYRELFYNNIESLLAGNFPVMRAVLSDRDWHALVRDFYREHPSHTPLFTEIGREFRAYLVTRQEQGRPDPGFLPELAHYEWLELAIGIDETELDQIPHDPQGNFLDNPPVLSPLAWPQAYRYPVHRIRADFKPAAAPEHPTYLLLARNRQDVVAFMETNLLSLQLFHWIQHNPQATGMNALRTIAEPRPTTERAGLIEHGIALLRAWHARDVLLGSAA